MEKQILEKLIELEAAAKAAFAEARFLGAGPEYFSRMDRAFAMTDAREAIERMINEAGDVPAGKAA